ncbi:hypothetical protein CBR_g54905 [Chara braunii]|uniref:RNA-directed DNA polymerase n=1 Tax=Chara braunii TaxID=69332 RepID=A0A388JPU7_CHABU|nr:hypothetical protein CBR_g54905 [Chara braunii]|eukprot:GBG59803.1 hypothetical protein CBR_g54905 [Chara braunii]
MTPTLTRWAAEIDQYDFELKPIKGKYNVVADALSRRSDYFGAIVHYLDIGSDLQEKIRQAYAQDPIYSDLLKRVKEVPETEPDYRTTEGSLFEITALQRTLLSAEVLRIYDPLLPTRVTTDASGYGIGAVLEQHDGVDWHPIEYFSKKVPVVHSIDDARKKELLAFVHALKRWRHLLLGLCQFQWVTDNNPLVFYKTQDTVNNTIARWMAFINQFHFFPDHIPGKSNRFVDALSRHPDHCTAVYSAFEIDDDLRNRFIRGYQADPEFRDKYVNCSSPNPAPSHYRIQEGYLLVHTQGKDLLCVPSDPHLRTRLLGEFHDAPATGHFGVDCTIGRLRERFWWPCLLGDVTRYCESCEDTGALPRRSARLAVRTRPVVPPRTKAQQQRLSKRKTPAASSTALTVPVTTGVLPACPVQRANEPVAAYFQRVQVFTDTVAAVKAQQEAAEAERRRLANEAAAQAQQTAEADAAARDQRNAASTESLIRSESQWTTFLQGMIFVPSDAQADPTPAEAEKTHLANLMLGMMRGIMWNNTLLQAHLRTKREQRQKYQQDIAVLTTAIRAEATQQQQLHQQLNSALARINNIEANTSAAPGCTIDETKQLNGDIGVFNGQDTISSTVATIKTDITKLQTRPDAATKNYKMPHFDISKFDDYNKSDALTWWQSFLTEASCRTVPTDDMMKALYLQLIGGAQAWMNHLAATKKCTIAELHTHIPWKEFEKLWLTRFMVRNVVKAAMNEVYTCSQGSMPTRAWTIKWQKIVTTPGFDLSFTNQRSEFFSRSCAGLRSTLGNEYDYDSFQAILDRANLVIQTDDKAANERQSQPHYVAKHGYQRPTHNNAVISKETVDLHAAAASSSDGGIVAALPPKRPKRVRKNKATQETASTGTGQQPWTAYKITKDVYDLRQNKLGKLSYARRGAMSLLTPLEPVALLAIDVTTGEHALVADSRATYEDYAAQLVPPLDQPSHVHLDCVCAACTPSASDPVSSPLISEDSTAWSRLEELDPLTREDFAWMPLPSTGTLPRPHCNALMATLRSYLHATVPAPLTDDGVAVVDLRSYLAKIDREYATQRYAETDAPLLYIRIQIGKATCSALIDCGASRNFMSQAFMARAGLGPRVRRQTQPTQVTLADGRTQKSIDQCVDDVPVYFAPLACEPVSFDILDTKFDMILGMSWLRSADHLVNFHDRTVHIRDRNGVLVPCTVATPHTSIACHVVSVARIRDAIARNDVEEMGLVFLHALPSPDGPAASPSDPHITHLLDEYGDVFEAPTEMVPDRPIRHGITLEASVVPPRGCIYRMSEEELEVLRAQLDDLLDKGWIRPSCSPYGAPVLFVRKKNKDLRLCINYRKLNAQTVKNADPLPRIDDLLERLGGATYFSKLDLKSGYHQIEIQSQDRYKTAFKTRYGHFECCKTTLAKAAAHAAEATLFCRSAAELFSMYVGEGEGIVRETFKRARMAAPSIIFIDDVDAIASRSCQKPKETKRNCEGRDGVDYWLEKEKGSDASHTVFCQMFCKGEGELDELRRQLKELVEKGWIRPSVSPYGSPVLFVPKKKEGTLRMCIDYRGLDAITVKNREPLPRIDDLLDRVQECRYFSKIDLKSGYHQIAIRPEDQHKTAFQTRYGLYEFVVMPFGLCNAPGTFQHAMNRIFHDYLDKFVVVNLDDILIFSKTVEEHVAHLDKVLGLLRQHKFKINGEKCEFGRTRVLYLDHEISAEGLKPDDAKVASIRDWRRPQSVTEMRSFLGMTGYYRTFWTDKCEAAFRHLKHALAHYEVLKLPDPDKPFIVTTDASQYGIDAVLAQQEGPKLRPVEYMSKKMRSQKLAKSTYEKKLYAVYKALTHWRHYLLGRFFILRTDHQTLRWMRTQPVLSDALKRWNEVIEQYDFDPQYLKGEYNKVADALLWRPDFSGALITEFDLTDDVTQSLVEAYRQDQFMSEIIRRLEAKDKKTSAEFELVNGLLFLEKAGNKRLCVPNSESLRSLFLGECHDATGHFGYKKTAANLLQRCWWPTMMKDAQLYVETCQVCQRDKPRTQAPLGLLKPLPIPERPGESLSMDFMDTLVTSKNGMRQIFVIVDRFSKFARLIAMPETAKIEYVIRLFKENWVRDFGLPKSIVSDRDVRFTSELSKAAAAYTDVKHSPIFRGKRILFVFVMRLLDADRSYIGNCLSRAQGDGASSGRGGGGGGGGGGLSASERLLSTLLTEMDGLELAHGVLVLGATSRPQIIDSALLRPGRFDMVIYVSPLDEAGRLETLQVHTRPMSLSRDVDLNLIARSTTFFTGAEIAGLCREAAMSALREDINADAVSSRHFESALAGIQPSLSPLILSSYASFLKNVNRRN